MENTASKSWKGFTIETRAFPVSHCALPGSVPDSYMAVVRIRRGEHVIAKWHLPRYAQHWASADEAHRQTTEYAIRAINSGCFAGTVSPGLVA
ncbi:hypothetical protein M3I54_32070 [Paraburkholderia sp. CNPSo 3274]|uniref:hypothetical protein n=1 Tax=Paraburkholderia sp. CNPSo 3274 TaxID=2940932 RepID=UPI0020B66C51|nr:hypothetical protein [Paraburkholderia sp. CNPSo 3274]MCP3711546.1 hypothetical protein [Paraburkholderia sp. CNPSo 3274]